MGKKQHMYHLDISYNSKELGVIEGRVEVIKQEHPEFSDRKARIWEVISRYQGDMGLSWHKVDYLTACIEHAID